MKDFDVLPVAPVNTGISLVIKSHTRCLCIVRSLYLDLTPSSSAVTGISVKS